MRTDRAGLAESSTRSPWPAKKKIMRTLRSAPCRGHTRSARRIAARVANSSIRTHMSSEAKPQVRNARENRLASADAPGRAPKALDSHRDTPITTARVRLIRLEGICQPQQGKPVAVPQMGSAQRSQLL